MYSFPDVAPVNPTSDEWGRDAYETFGELKAAFPNLYNIKDDRTDEQKKYITTNKKRGQELVPSPRQRCAFGGKTIRPHKKYNKKNNGVKTENNKSNAVFSIPDTDSEGRKLSPEQREFFKNSKVVDSKGRLLEVYHGTDAEFTVFDREMIGSKNGRFEGAGFNFTPQ